MFQEINQIDTNILLYIQQNWRNSVLNEFFSHYTVLGNAGLMWIFITILLLAFKKTRKTGICCALAMILNLIIDNVILKNIVARPRPYDTIDGLKCIIKKQMDYSFPSGHTGASFAAAVCIAMNEKMRLYLPAIFLAILMGVSRIYVGVHYPSDVIAGAVIGSLCAVMAKYFYQMMETKRKNKQN